MTRSLATTAPPVPPRTSPDLEPYRGDQPGQLQPSPRLPWRRGASTRTPDPRWVRPALVALLALTALAYLWDLSASGYANSFYAAAVQAGTESWKAFFFGSLDRSSFITVDKPPGSLWVMELSGRLFGFSSWSMLIPQALEGVAAVGLVYAAVKRWFGAPAGLLAGAVLACTPVAALMFRFNNPDALMVLLMVASAYTVVRAVERAGTRWIVAAGALLGFAFLAKMLQAFTVLPAFALVYLLAAPTTLGRRLWQLALAGVALVVAAGWWVAVVALVPASSRPMVDGSPDNSILNLIFDYNGLGRLSGSGGPGGGGGGGGTSFSGATGIFRLFNDLMGGQASWLLPASLLVLVAGLVWRGRAPRTDRTRAALLLWGGWLVVTGAVFSFGRGVIHTYYTVALAPAIAALVGIGGALLWHQRERIGARVVGAGGIIGTAVWAYVLLDRTPGYHPWVRIVVLAAGIAGGIALVLAPMAGRWSRPLTGAAGAAAIGACLLGPVVFTLTTIATPHTGSIPSAGPATDAGIGGPGGAGGAGGVAGGGDGAPGGGDVAGGAGGVADGGGGSGAPGGGVAGGAVGGAGARLGGQRTGDPGGSGFPGGSESTHPAGTPSGLGSGARPAAGGFPGGSSSSGRPGAGTGTFPAGADGSGGPGSGTTVSAALTRALEADAGHYRWVAATFGSQSAAGFELAANEPVMAIGGFNGQGGNISLATFESYVAKGDIHYFVASSDGGGIGGGGPGGAGGSERAISSWVASHFKAETIGGQTVYNMSVRTR